MFEPVARIPNGGNELQRSKTVYKNTVIYNEVYIPHNFFKSINETFLVDVIVSNDSKINNLNHIDEYRYTEDGFGYPVFSTLEHAVEYINTIK